MKARYSLLAVAFLASALPCAVDAQPAGKVPALGYLSQFSSPGGPPSPPVEAFLKGMSELGYTDGKNITIKYRYTEGKNERIPALTGELADLKVDVIVVETGAAALEAKKVTQAIPIVMEGSGDAVGIGLVESLDRPGGNVTGMTAFTPDTAAKRLQFLAAIVPNLTRVGVLWAGPGHTVTDKEWSNTSAAAAPLKVQLIGLEARGGPAGLPDALAEAKRQQVQAIVHFDVPLLYAPSPMRQTIDWANANQVPAMFQTATFARQGGLMAYGVDNLDLARRSASHVDKILKGAKPADLPIGRPDKFVFFINMKTAKAIGLSIPPSVLSQATTVIE